MFFGVVFVFTYHTQMCGGNFCVAAVLTSVTSATEVTCTVFSGHEFPDTSAIASGAWVLDGDSFFSYNANEIRSKIDTAKTAGADIRAVICGHGHGNNAATVESIPYYEFTTANGAVKAGVMHLDDDGEFRVSGTTGFTSYNIDDYFVGPAGSDSNLGTTRASPFLTVMKAEGVATTAGQTVNVLSGTYREYANISQTGSDGSPITWEFETGSKVTATEIFSGFAGPDGNGEYTIACTTEAKIVLRNGSYLTEGTAGSLSTEEWDWDTNVLYLKDDPASYIIEAGQRDRVFNFGSGAVYVTLNNPVAYGANVTGIYVSSTPDNLIFNNPVAYGCVTGISIEDSSLDLIRINNPYAHHNSNTGIKIQTSSAVYFTNLRSFNNGSIDLRIRNTAAPTIVGAVTQGSPTGISIENTGTPGPIIINAIATDASSKVVNSTNVGASEIKNSDLYGTITWGNTTDTDNILVDPLVDSIGKLQTGSPCIDTGFWHALNQDGQVDPFGKYVHKEVNIGVDQGKGAPIIQKQVIRMGNYPCGF